MARASRWICHECWSRAAASRIFNHSGRPVGQCEICARRERCGTFAELWPFYLREHSKPRTRVPHYAGTSLVVAILAFAVVTGRWWWLLLVPLAGSGFAWLGHFKVYRERLVQSSMCSMPCSLSRAKWSFISLSRSGG